MNKRLVYIFVFLVAGLFVVSACKQAVGRPAINRNIVDEFELSRESTTVTTYSGRESLLNVKNYEGNLLTSNRIFYYEPRRRAIKLGRDMDRPLIIEEGALVTNTSIGESELSEMRINFLYDKDRISHILRIRNIDTLSNRTDFYDETTDTSYENQEFMPELNTEFTFLPSIFELKFSERDDTITFSDINDERDGISRIYTISHEIITLSEQNPMITIRDMRENIHGRGGIDINYYVNQPLNIQGLRRWGNNPMFRNAQIFQALREGGDDRIIIRYPLI